MNDGFRSSNVWLEDRNESFRGPMWRGNVIQMFDFFVNEGCVAVMTSTSDLFDAEGEDGAEVHPLSQRTRWLEMGSAQRDSSREIVS